MPSCFYTEAPVARETLADKGFPLSALPVHGSPLPPGSFAAAFGSEACRELRIAFVFWSGQQTTANDTTSDPSCAVQVDVARSEPRHSKRYVASPAASAPTSEQGPRDQLRRDAVGRIVMEDGAVRMHAPGKAQTLADKGFHAGMQTTFETSKVPSPFCPFLCTFLLRCLPASTPRPQLHGRR